MITESVRCRQAERFFNEYQFFVGLGSHEGA
jgi:hypothetical protein